MAAAQIDSSALFHDLAYGAESSVSGYIAMLAAADALSRAATEVQALPNMIVFALFQGEAFGRLGSRRFAAELQQFACEVRRRRVASPHATCRDSSTRVHVDACYFSVCVCVCGGSVLYLETGPPRDSRSAHCRFGRRLRFRT